MRRRIFKPRLTRRELEAVIDACVFSLAAWDDDNHVDVDPKDMESALTKLSAVRTNV